MSELKPRIEFTKPARIDLSSAGILKAVPKLAVPLAKLPGVQAKPVAAKASPIGVLYAEVVMVKFREGSGVRYDLGQSAFVRAKTDKPRLARMERVKLGEAKLASELGGLGKLLKDVGVRKVEPMFLRADAALEQDQAESEKKIGEELADLGLYHALTFEGATPEQLERAIRELHALDCVEIAHAAPIPYPAGFDIGPTTPAFSGQGYLDAAPNGIDARYAWGIAGGRGEGVRIIDVEFSWHLDHEDLPDPGQYFFNGSGLNLAISNYAEHGTAVLGVLGARENRYGFTGIAPAAQLGVNTWFSIWGIAHAIEDASMQLRRGDVLLIEIHYPGPTTTVDDVFAGRQTGFMPVEYFPASFDAIRRASARGVIVVEAAGNGQVDLDAPLYEGRLDRTRRDSGAIMVGAGTPVGRVPEWFTNYGSRVDVHGWGSSVATLGYGDVTVPGAEGDVRQWYTRGFNGTSSASPIVAGAVADIQGVRTRDGLPVLEPLAMRELLRRTGTPQANDARQIGPLPNLRPAIDSFHVIPPPSAWPSMGGIILGQPAVGRSLDGRMNVFAIGTDGRIWHLWQTAPSNGWTGWAAMTTSNLPPTLRFVGVPAVASAADGRMELFVRGDDNRIWHVYQTAPNGDWSGWDNMGGNATSDPAVGINDNGRLEVFFRGPEGALYHNWQMWPNGGWFTFGWQQLGGNLQGAPTVGRNADLRLEVFVRGTGNALQSIAQLSPGGGWGGWNHHGGVLTSDPSVGSLMSATGLRLAVFGRGTDGQVWSRQQVGPNAGLADWIPMGGVLPVGSRICTQPMRNGGLTIYARQTNGHVLRRRQNASTLGWTGWDDLGGNLTSDPASGMNADGRLEVFAVGSDRSLVHVWE
ncbi:S8 family serine peptidase [Nannocystaceae bacterium ST9]